MVLTIYQNLVSQSCQWQCSSYCRIPLCRIRKDDDKVYIFLVYLVIWHTLVEICWKSRGGGRSSKPGTIVWCYSSSCRLCMRDLIFFFFRRCINNRISMETSRATSTWNKVNTSLPHEHPILLPRSFPTRRVSFCLFPSLPYLLSSTSPLSHRRLSIWGKKAKNSGVVSAD